MKHSFISDIINLGNLSDITDLPETRAADENCLMIRGNGENMDSRIKYKNCEESARYVCPNLLKENCNCEQYFLESNGSSSFYFSKNRFKSDWKSLIQSNHCSMYTNFTLLTSKLRTGVRLPSDFWAGIGSCVNSTGNISQTGGVIQSVLLMC